MTTNSTPIFMFNKVFIHFSLTGNSWLKLNAKKILRAVYGGIVSLKCSGNIHSSVSGVCVKGDSETAQQNFIKIVGKPIS